MADDSKDYRLHEGGKGCHDQIVDEQVMSRRKGLRMSTGMYYKYSCALASIRLELDPILESILPYGTMSFDESYAATREKSKAKKS